MKFMGIHKKEGTFALRLYDKKTDSLNNYFVQFSLQSPWLIPHKEYRFDNGSWLCGWLFFYLGNIISKKGCQ